MKMREMPMKQPMSTLKPRALRPGDTIGVVAPSGCIRTPDGCERALSKLRDMGYAIRVGESVNKIYGYLSGEDTVRARDINAMFADPAIDAVFCIRGGYGAPRLLDGIDYGLVRAHPKIFVGYSDITALHIALNERCGLVTLHAPMAASDMIYHDYDALSHASLLRALTSTDALGEIANPPGYDVQTLQAGTARGKLVGGNLTLVAYSLGTPYEIDTRGRLLFLEDIGEKTYRLDGMINQLRLAGKFEDCAGVVLGDFRDCPIEYEGFGLSLDQIIRDLILPSGKPMIANLRAGHCCPKLTLPMGIEYELDASNGRLTALESAFL